MPMIPWVLIKKLTELTGITDDAVRAYIKRGVWLMGIHWKKAPNSRIFVNLEEIKKWIEKKE